MADKALDDLSQANEELRVDIDKWKEAKDREVVSLMRKVADDHINFHQKVSASVKYYLPSSIRLYNRLLNYEEHWVKLRGCTQLATVNLEIFVVEIFIVDGSYEN